MLDINEWGWSVKPESDVEFEAMMRSLDIYLASQQVLPHQRPHAGRALIGRLMAISDPYPPSMFGLGGTADDPILRRSADWFGAAYQGRFNPHFRVRSAIVDLRGTPWRMHFPLFYGEVSLFLDRDMTNTGGPPSQPSRNMLHHIDGFTPFYAARLSEEELDHVHQAFVAGFAGIDALDLFNDQTLFDAARLDYEHSVGALASGVDCNNAKWETAQTAEKVMKGMLISAGATFPKQSDGHKIPVLGNLIGEHYDLTIPEQALKTIDCHPKMRYAEGDTSYQESLSAHQALLALLPMLAKSYYTPRAKPA